MVSYESAVPLRRLLPTLREVVDEVVVVDNASGDDSVALVRALVPEAVVVELPANRGFAAGVNAGVAAATGDLLLLCNPDVVLTRAAVAELVAAAGRHPGDVVGPRVRFPDGRLQLSRSGLPTLRNLLGEQVLVPESAAPGSWPARWWPRWRSYGREVPGPVLSGCSLLVPRSAFAAVGPFDEGYFLYWEEVDWQLRARAAGRTAWLVPTAEVTHVRGGSSGPADPRRDMLFAAATRRFLRRWMGPWRRPVALALLGAGQLVRLVLWTAPPLRRRPQAAARRGQHARMLRGLWAPGDAPPEPRVR